MRELWISEIRDEGESKRDVGRTTALSVGIALGLDIANQLAAFSDWSVALRSWAVTILVASGIAFAASRAIGRAQLELWRAKERVEHLSRTDPLPAS